MANLSRPRWNFRKVAALIGLGVCFMAAQRCSICHPPSAGASEIGRIYLYITSIQVMAVFCVVRMLMTALII